MQVRCVRYSKWRCIGAISIGFDIEALATRQGFVSSFRLDRWLVDIARYRHLRRCDRVLDANIDHAPILARLVSRWRDAGMRRSQFARATNNRWLASRLRLRPNVLSPGVQTPRQGLRAPIVFLSLVFVG